MTDRVRIALHQAHTGTKDVLAGYETLENRAEPEIQPIVQDLKTMHHRHARDLEQRLSMLGEPADQDASIRGTVNKAVVALRDWTTTLDEGALPFVRNGEEKLMKIYDESLQDLSTDEDPETAKLLTTQWQEIGAKVKGLPAS